MAKKQAILMRGIKILFMVIFLSGLTGGCATIPPSRRGAKKRITNDVLTFRDLQQIDLDKDGEKEIVAIYMTGANSSGVKVIKFSGERGNVIFERIFDTPDTRFEMMEAIPTIIVEEKVQVPGCGRTRLKSIYSWDGKAFVLELE